MPAESETGVRTTKSKRIVDISVVNSSGAVVLSVSVMNVCHVPGFCALSQSSTSCADVSFAVLVSER